MKVKIPSYRGEDRRSTPHRDTRHRSRTYRKHSAHSTQRRTSGCHITGSQLRKGRPGCGSVTVHRAIPTKFLFSPMKQRGGTFSGIFPYFRGMLQRGWSGTASRCIPGSRLSDPQKKETPWCKISDLCSPALMGFLPPPLRCSRPHQGLISHNGTRLPYTRPQFQGIPLFPNTAERHRGGPVPHGPPAPPASGR